MLKLRSTLPPLATFVMLLIGGWYAGRFLADRVASGDIGGTSRMVAVGDWYTSQSLGSSEGGAILVAWIAKTGIMPLSHTEVAYFFTTQDAVQQPLNPDCSYTVSVPDVDARWWSVSVYDELHKPIPNAENRYSVNSDSGANEVLLSRGPQVSGVKAWLPLGQASNIELLFRVYQPGTAFDPKSPGALPTVARVGEC